MRQAIALVFLLSFNGQNTVEGSVGKVLTQVEDILPTFTVAQVFVPGWFMGPDCSERAVGLEPWFESRR